MGKSKKSVAPPAVGNGPIVVDKTTTTVASSSSADAADSETKPAPKKVMRSLLEEPKITKMYVEDNKILTKELYESEVDEVMDRSEFHTMMQTSHTNKQKLEGFKRFTSMLGEPNNQQVLRVFLIVSCLMVVVPIGTLFIGMHIVAPLIGAEEQDRAMYGGFMSLAASVVIMAGYVVYALKEDELFDERVQQKNVSAARKASNKEEAAKKKRI